MFAAKSYFSMFILIGIDFVFSIDKSFKMLKSFDDAKLDTYSCKFIHSSPQFSNEVVEYENLKCFFFYDTFICSS
jgi:hypothetical protein